MADIVDKETRSRMMSGIRGTNTKPEFHVRKLLHRNGFRYRLHVKELPGKPDIVLPRYRAAIFVSGCFWHGHDCHLFKLPSSNTSFWEQKIARNRQNDAHVIQLLKDAGWRVAIVWECALRGKSQIEETTLTNQIIEWLRSPDNILEVRGKVSTN